METNCEYISYESTGYFSKMMTDYVKGDEKLKVHVTSDGQILKVKDKQ